MLGTQKRPRCVGGAKKALPIDFDVNAGTPFSPNFHIRFPDTPSFLDRGSLSPPCHQEKAPPKRG